MNDCSYIINDATDWKRIFKNNYFPEKINNRKNVKIVLSLPIICQRNNIGEVRFLFNSIVTKIGFNITFIEYHKQDLKKIKKKNNEKLKKIK